MNTQTPIVDPEAENDPTSVTARTDIAEHPTTSVDSAATFPAALLLLAGFIYSICTFIIGAVMGDVEEPDGTARIVADILLFLLAFILITSLAVISSGRTPVCQFLEKYIDTVHCTGLVLVPPLINGKRASVKIHNLETNELKVNDSDGNPVSIAAIVIWQVADTVRVVFVVREYEKLIKAQTESALYHIATTHPYDEPDPGEASLREGIDLMNAEFVEEVANRVALAGLEIVEARISPLVYAPEIAQTMFQHQQAGAVIAAREQIVEGAITMADQAFKRLGDNGIVELNDEREVQMVSNLPVVLCSDTRTQPVVDTGSLC